MKSILDPDFKYVNAASTDLRKTFERIRREQGLTTPKPPAVVIPLPPRKEAQCSVPTAVTQPE